jgi:tyrosyl-tRNA synthetase
VPDVPTTAPPEPGGLLDDLAARGLVHDSTDPAALATRLAEGPITLYCGFDPTADSLHVGNLQQILLLRRFQLAGHRPLALAGGATGMVGDPGGRDAERPLLDLDVLDANLAAIKAQLGRFLDFDDGPSQARLVDNREWTAPMGVLDFLRDVGKHVTVNAMLAKESVRTRLERADGISFTEFSYMLLQANDFYVLHRDLGCELQVAGSDQWGNITAGIDLIRRRAGAAVHGLTSPLLVRSDGQKFGKSAGGALWLDRDKTSPYQLFQYFLQVDDDDVGPMLARLTLLPVEEVTAVVADHLREPSRRTGQRRLAREVVAVVHGAEVLPPIEEASQLLFGGDPLAAGPDAFELLAGEVPTTTVGRSDLGDLVGLFAVTGLARSKGEVRRNRAGYYLNGVAIGEREALEEADLVHGRWALLRRGRRDHHLLRISG